VTIASTIPAKKHPAARRNRCASRPQSVGRHRRRQVRTAAKAGPSHPAMQTGFRRRTEISVEVTAPASRSQARINNSRRASASPSTATETRCLLRNLARRSPIFRSHFGPGRPPVPTADKPCPQKPAKGASVHEDQDCRGRRRRATTPTGPPVSRHAQARQTLPIRAHRFGPFARPGRKKLIGQKAERAEKRGQRQGGKPPQGSIGGVTGKKAPPFAPPITATAKGTPAAPAAPRVRGRKGQPKPPGPARKSSSRQHEKAFVPRPPQKAPHRRISSKKKKT